MERKEMTTRAKSILSAIRKIEDWCNENLQGESINVFVMHKRWDTYMWHNFTYSSEHKKLYFLRGDHGRWGANDWCFETGMSERDFDYYTIGQGINNCITSYEKTNSDGNLIFDEELSGLIRAWSSEKTSLLLAVNEEKEFEKFDA